MAHGIRETRVTEAWPELRLDEWQDTYATLHLWTQLVGKTLLALAPFENHYWHVTLRVTPRGLRTPPIPWRDRTFDLEFDFIDHVLVARTSDGLEKKLPLAPQTTASFYRGYRAMLRSLDIDVKMWPVPSEIANPIPFARDETHSSYDPDAAQRCWRVMVQVDRVMKEFRSGFVGKQGPVAFWWGAFDLSSARFSGRPSGMTPHGIPNLPDKVAIEGASHEHFNAGWWPGTPGGPVQEPAFFAYTLPQPEGCDTAPLRPVTAGYHPVLSEWILPYEVVRESADPDATLLDFLQSTYEAGATLGGWDRAALEHQPQP
jgi:hypothetical protein